VLQCVAVCCSVLLQDEYISSEAIEGAAGVCTSCSVLQCVVVVYCSGLLQGGNVSPEAVGGALGVLQCVAVCCSVVPCVVAG